MILCDKDVITLYRQWSEEFYAAGFLASTEETVRLFRKWIQLQLNPETELPLEEYEEKMLLEFYTQEHNNEV